ncbi:MAG: ATP-dependent Clp protease proteolytic subunit [Clostridia bacterium]|nr:ATP-dependent Clp protease proteolytic subunit [Clostridia bacterium]
MEKNLETEEKSGSGTAVEIPDGAIVTEKRDSSVFTLVIAGQVEGHSELPAGQKATKYELIIPQLVSVEESEDIKGLLLILNTVGGDVEAGLALSELIVGMRKPTASLVLGGGHSIGVPLAVSADRSFIVPTATMTLHPVRAGGLVLGAPQSFNSIERMQERIIGFVAAHSRMSADRMRSLMLNPDEIATDMGSVLDGNMAVKEGLIDQIGGLGDALDFLRSSF